MKSRENLLYLFILIVAMTSLIGAGWRYHHVKQEAEGLNQDRLQVETLSRAISQLKQRPALAGSNELELSQLSKLIEQAAKEADVPLDHLIRIWPEQAQRLRDSVYLEKPTQILFRDVTMKQIITFLYKISSEEGGLRIKSLRLNAPRDALTSETWVVETTLTYLIYSPPTTHQVTISHTNMPLIPGVNNDKNSRNLDFL